jgi:hypothetical protein
MRQRRVATFAIEVLLYYRELESLVVLRHEKSMVPLLFAT